MLSLPALFFLHGFGKTSGHEPKPYKRHQPRLANQYNQRHTLLVRLPVQEKLSS